MKKLSKVLVLVLSSIMVLAMSASVFAATSDASISVTGLTAGDKVASYQVIEWKAGEGWAFKAPFDTLTAADLEEILGTPAKPDDPSTPEVDPTPAVAGKITQAMADKISALASGATMETLTGTTWTKGTATDPVAPGLYMVVAVAKESGVVYNPAFVAADYTAGGSNTISITATYSDTAVAKKTTFTTKKTVKDHEDAIQKAKASMVGDIVGFDAESTIPVFLDSYKNPSFTLTDEITDGMELVIDAQHPLVITYGTKTANVTSASFSNDDLTFTKDSNVKYTIDFKKAYLAANAAPVSVKVEYSGQVTAAATFNVNWQKNTVTVTYSNGPDTEKGIEKDVTNHYEFSIGAEIKGRQGKKGYESVKVGVDKDGNELTELTEVTLDDGTTVDKARALEGATFGLYKSQAGAEAKDANDLVVNKNYPTGATFTTDIDGIITFTGLDEGTYYLKEISAPEGFIADTAVHTVVIDATYVTKNVTETVDGMEVKYQTSVLDNYTVTIDNQTTTYTFNNAGPTIVDPVINDVTTNEARIKNTKGVELPSTGGIGTTIFYILGSLLVAGCGIVLISRKRMENNK